MANIKMMPMDLHTHSALSHDGQSQMSLMCSQAYKRGIRVLAFTEHVDFTKEGGACSYYRHHNIARRSMINVERDKYFHEMEVLRGFELGQPHLNREAVKEVLGQNPLDIVLASVRSTSDGRDIYSLDLRDPDDCCRLMDDYLDQLYKMAWVSDYDVLTYIDRPLRLMYSAGINSLRPWEKKVMDILQIAASRDKALEINTRSLLTWQKRISPEPWVIAAFMECGGMYFTIGSDSHTAGQVGLGIREARQLLLDTGNEYVVYYKERTPVLVRLKSLSDFNSLF